METTSSRNLIILLIIFLPKYKKSVSCFNKMFRYCIGKQDQKYCFVVKYLICYNFIDDSW